METAVYRRLNSAEMLEIDGETLILNPESFAVTKINETGGWIWRMIGDGATVEQLTQQIMAVYEGAGPERIRSEIANFLRQLEEIGLVRCAD